MATGIVSKAMRLDSSATLSGALLSAGIAPGTSPPGSASPATSASPTLPALPLRLGPGASERQPGIMFHCPPVQLCLAQLFQQVHPLAGQVTVGTVEVPVHDHRHGSLTRPLPVAVGAARLPGPCCAVPPGAGVVSRCAPAAHASQQPFRPVREFLELYDNTGENLFRYGPRSRCPAMALTLAMGAGRSAPGTWRRRFRPPVASNNF
jgi:hypothetical protein